MLKKIINFFPRFARMFIPFVLSALFLPAIIVSLFSISRVFAIEDVPAERAAIVFGAGLTRDGSAGPVLRDRVETAVKLYQQNRVEKILMSGDNRFENYNEPEAMRQYALQLGIPDKDVVLDYAGRRTYDTCYRAREIFQLQSAILVTQSFHLPRALFLCNALGVKAVGVEADNTYFRKISRLSWHTREIFATAQSVLDVYILQPLPVLGDPEPIR